ncbi:uncharacterized protein LOC128855129 [Anastrepha ludens]|uniref:uncharacterized protein LOC128855129 n=1 Tax=Anastrepha ludens TaxID=28586 RepID=UPI0023AF4F53|nr:uncharacterized protein LOC128855129 [Anastrepha ludens]
MNSSNQNLNINILEKAKIATTNPSLDLPKETADGSNSSGELVKNPFQRSSRLAHSPPLIGRTRSASPCMQYSSVAKEATTEELNRSISAKIKELTEMMELPKRNINQPMRDLVSSISELHKKLERSILTSRIRMLKGSKSVVLEAKNECTQTSPLIKRVTDGTPKRCIDTVAARKSPAKKSKSDRDGTLKATPVSTKEQTSSEGWNTVINKKNRKGNNNKSPKIDGKQRDEANTRGNRRRQRPPRKDAIVVKSVGNVSYADILKRVKTEPCLQELNSKVYGVKKTANGDLLLVLERSSDPNTQKINEAVKAALGDVVEVRALTELHQIEIRDLDEITTKDEVHEAITSQFRELNVPLSSVANLRKAYGGTQTATLKVTPEIATKLTAAGKIRIGLVICRIREKLDPKRCFKCMEYGHVAARCKSTDDFTKSCFKCGSKDHQAKSCTQTASCLICKKKQISDTAHAMTSNKCPLYQRALKEMRHK